jgi:peptidoglycan/LPS O-acetylase OafA/YrhL
MATTKDRLEELTRARRELDDREIVAFQRARVASPPESPPAVASDGPTGAVPRKPLGVRLLEPITGRWPAIGSVAWLVLLAIGIAVEPPPTNPNAVDPWFVSALGTMLLLAMGGTLVGFWLRRRWGLAASLSASGLLVLSTIMCPVSGHHTGVGAWWVVQLGCGLGLVAASSLGLRRAQPR